MRAASPRAIASAEAHSPPHSTAISAKLAADPAAIARVRLCGAASASSSGPRSPARTPAASSASAQPAGVQAARRTKKTPPNAAVRIGSWNSTRAPSPSARAMDRRRGGGSRPGSGSASGSAAGGGGAASCGSSGGSGGGAAARSSAEISGTESAKAQSAMPAVQT